MRCTAAASRLERKSLHRDGLPAFGLLRNLQQVDTGRLVLVDERVYADDDAVARLDRALVAIAELGDLPLEEAGFDRFDYAAVLGDLSEILSA